MTFTRLLQVLKKLIPSERITLVLSAFKQDPILWKGLNDPELPGKIDREWLIEGKDFTPSTLALFVLDVNLLSGNYPDVSPSTVLLEESMLAYEDYVQDKKPVESFTEAAALALAVTEKFKLNEDWNKTLREIVTKQNLEDSDELISFWGASLAILCGWVEDKPSFLQAVLQVKQPEDGFNLVKHIAFCLPLEQEEQMELLKGALATLSLNHQVTGLQSLRWAGKSNLTQMIAKGLFGRHVIGTLEEKNPYEIWKNSEKSLTSSAYTRQLAALAQMAGEFELADRLLKNSEKALTAELAGVQIQKASLQAEQGLKTSAAKPKVAESMLEDEDILSELALVSEDVLPVTEASGHSAVADFQDAAAIFASGNETLAKEMGAKSIHTILEKWKLTKNDQFGTRAINWSPRVWLDQLVKLGLWQEAQQVLKELLDDSPADISLLNQSVQIAQALSDQAECQSALEDLTILDRENISAKRLLAKTYKTSENWDAAFESYADLVNHFVSNETEDLLGYAESALKNSQPAMAIEFAQKVLVESSENGQALAILGSAQHKMGNSEKALESLTRSVELNPEVSEPWLLLANVYQEKGEMARSIDTLRTAKAAVPGNPKITMQLARELLTQGQAADALSVLNADASTSSQDVSLALLKISAMKQLHLSDLDEMIKKTYRSFSKEAEVIHEYADSLLKQGQLDAARKIIEPLALANQAKTDWKLTYVDTVLGEDYRRILGAHQAEKSLQEKAEELLSEVLANEPENVYARILSAEANLKNGQAAKAFESLSDLLGDPEAQSSNWLERIQAGFSWAANLLGKFNFALAGIQNVVEARPDWAGARQTLAEVSQASGEIEEAVNQANQVLQIAPDVVESVEWFAKFMSALGKVDEAEKTISEISKTHSNKLPLLLKLAEMKLDHGDIQEAKGIAENFKRYLSKSKANKELVQAARLFDRLEDSETAVECLKMRLAIAGSQIQNPFTDLAGYQRSKGKLDQALNVVGQMRHKFGSQSWIELIEAETIHAKGESERAFELLKELSENNQLVPEIKQLNFIPAEWVSLLQENANADSLIGALAFETGNYQRVLEQLELSKKDSSCKVLAIEADYALGCGKETLGYLDVSPQDVSIYQESGLTAQIAELLMDSDQLERACRIIDHAVEMYPEDTTLALVESRYLAATGDLIGGEQLFDQALQKLSKISKLTDAKSTLTIRNLIKAAVELKCWGEALDWSKVLSAAQPKNLSIVKLGLQVLVFALEFSFLTEKLGITQHMQMDAESIRTIRDELSGLLVKVEAQKNADIEHWIARAKVALDPTQANIRRLALITPEAGDIAAMMIALHKSGQTSTALQLAKKQEADANVLYATAFCLKDSDSAQAIEVLNKCQKLKVVQPWSYALSAALYQQTGGTYSAINEIEEALQYWPEESQWHVNAADYWQSTGDQQNVVAHLENAVKLTPENPNTQFLLGKAYLYNKETAKAIEVLEPVSKQEVNQYEVWETLAEAYYQLGNSAKSLNAAERASSINAFSVKPYLLGAKINLDNGETKKGLEQAQKAVKQDSQNAEGLVLLAKAWLANGDKLQALQCLEKAVHAKNASVQVMIDHALLIKEINGAANAKPLFESLVQQYPDNLELINLLAEAQLACGDKTGAEITAHRSLKLQEYQPRIQKFLGKLELEGGHLDQAIHHYSQAIAQEPQQVDVYLDLSNAYQQQRDYDSALKTLKVAIDLAPSDTRPVMAAVNLMRNAKDYANAEALLRQAAEIAPSDLNIRRQLGAVIALNMVHSSQEASSHI